MVALYLLNFSQVRAGGLFSHFSYSRNLAASHVESVRLLATVLQVLTEGVIFEEVQIAGEAVFDCLLKPSVFAFLLLHAQVLSWHLLDDLIL